MIIDTNRDLLFSLFCFLLTLSYYKTVTIMRKYSSLLIVVAIITTLISCNNKTDSSKTITVSILPEKYLVKSICGEEYKINVLIPPGASPATFDLTSKHAKALLKSKLYFPIGTLPYEQNHIKNLLKDNKTVKTVELSKGLDLIEHEHFHGDCKHNTDPHIWTSPNNIQIMAKTIYETLCETYPSDKDLFRENYENLISIFKNLDIEIANKLDKKINRSFIIFHPSLTYFARDYNLEQIEIEKNGKEASPVHIKDILNQSKESQVNIIFIQKEFNSKEAQYIANSIGAEIFVINPLNEDIYGELKKIGDILARKL